MRVNRRYPRWNGTRRAGRRTAGPRTTHLQADDARRQDGYRSGRRQADEQGTRNDEPGPPEVAG